MFHPTESCDHCDHIEPLESTEPAGAITAEHHAGVEVPRLSPTLRAMLLTSPLLDELTIGILVVALPMIRDELRLTYEQTGFIFTFGSLSALAIEPLINLLSDRHSKRLFLLGALLSLVVSWGLTTAATSYGMLLLAVALIFPGVGIALGLAQATLIDAAPDTASHTLTRWTVMASVGDLLAPVAVGAITGFGSSWRQLGLVSALLWLIAAASILPQRFPPHEAQSMTEHDEKEPPLWQRLATGLRDTLRDHTLLRWVCVVTLCTMLDEVFLAFMGLYLRDALHANAWQISLALGAFLAGGIIGLLVLDRAHIVFARRGEALRGERILLGLALLVLVNMVVLLVAHSIWISAATLLIIGAGAAGWYPLAKAEAYALRPGKTGEVRALESLGEPFDMLLPLFIGIVAGRFGISVGIAVLGLAPIGVLLLTPRRQ